jgi:hypothetical protein
MEIPKQSPEIKDDKKKDISLAERAIGEKAVASSEVKLDVPLHLREAVASAGRLHRWFDPKKIVNKEVWWAGHQKIKDISNVYGMQYAVAAVEDVLSGLS